MKNTVSKLVSAALEDAIAQGELELAAVPDPAIERPRDAAHGDWATTVALRLSKEAHKNPREIAEIIARRLEDEPSFAAVEIAGPGFLNMRLSQEALAQQLREVRTQKESYGKSSVGEGQRVQIEFVSANPVGPMHVGHGRWAALGDSLARVMTHAGYDVEREFYINDAGNQMDIFGASVSARYLELCGRKVAFPEEGYRGAYIKDIAQEILDEEGDIWADKPADEREHYFKERSYKQVLAHVKQVLHDFGVDFDVWFSERVLHAKGAQGTTAIEDAIEALRSAGYIFESEGALWFRSTDFGDDKDRVLVKADGSYTYFAADIAYHKNKFDRGFDRVINIWGADHHGYVARMKGACAALGNEGKLDVIIGQLVNLFRGGEAVRMSKRTGEMVTFEELVEDVGADAARYWFLRRSTDQQVDFDIDLAREQSSDNPIYYIQYAHARICSIIRKAFDAQDEVLADDLMAAVGDDINLAVLTDESELALIRKLTELPEVVELAARDMAPNKLTHFGEELAATFHHFYSQCRVMHDDKDIAQARLYLVDATRTTLRTVFGMLGISAPEKM